ncbi:MOCOS [Symbiodinium sp. CCMP2592]|nr:MOCOS [Symbiodinium sp. CCMP2592]
MALSPLDQHIRIHAALESWIAMLGVPPDHRNESESPGVAQCSWAQEWADELTQQWEQTQDVAKEHLPATQAGIDASNAAGIYASSCLVGGVAVVKASPRPSCAPNLASGSVQADSQEDSMEDTLVDDSQLKFADVHAFEGALEDWKAKVREVSADYRTSLCVTFNPQISSARAFHDLVESLGISIIAQPKSDDEPVPRQYPRATVAGDTAQPALIVIFKPAPGEQKVTLQANLRLKTLCAKGRRGAVEAHIEKMLAYFGAVVKVTSSAPAAGKKTHVKRAAGQTHLDIRTLGRISWLSGEVWDEALLKISMPLQTLEEAIADTLLCVDLRPTQFGGTISKKLRRSILDSAAWARDVLVVMAGHMAGAVKVRGARRAVSATLSPFDYATQEEFKEAVKEASAREQFRAVHSYAQLRQRDRGASEKFLSSFFNKESHFRISLLDQDTGQSLSEEDMLSALVEDMMARAANDFPADSDVLRQVDADVAEVRRQGGFNSNSLDASRIAPDDVQNELYTEAELVFVLGCGIAQGRRFSVHVFNCLLSGLRDEVRRVLPYGVCAWLPKNVMRAVSNVDLTDPSSDFVSKPQMGTLQPILERLQDEALPPHQQTREVQEVLESLPSFADRCALLDALGSCPVEPLQYVDDTTVPCSSPGAIRYVVNKSASSACARYAARTKSQFHYGSNKTCAMALLNSPPLEPCSLDCEVVSQKTILGVLFDQDLTFEPLLRATLARAWSMFVDLFHTAETGGFSVPVLVSQVIIRLHPVILCVAAFIALVPGVLGKLNQLQWRWGKTILGCRYQRELRYHLVVAQCGWDMRLGTCLLLELVMMSARILLLPTDHPTARLAACLQAAPCVSWFTQVNALIREASLHRALPTLLDCGIFTCQEINAARTDTVLRKKILHRYRHEVVGPILLEHDRRHLAECLSYDIPVFGCSLAALGFYTLKLDWEIFHLETPNTMWFNFRAWSLVRITARWPLPLLGFKDFPLHLTCPACGEPEASIVHLLCECAATRESFASFCNEAPGCLNRPTAFLRALFGTAEMWLESQNYVGTCLRLAFF